MIPSFPILTVGFAPNHIHMITAFSLKVVSYDSITSDAANELLTAALEPYCPGIGKSVGNKADLCVDVSVAILATYRFA